jgi:hypothetical protein
MDDVSFDTPNCPRCLKRLQIAGTEEHPYLMCPGCRVAHLGYVPIAYMSGRNKSAPPSTRR